MDKIAPPPLPDWLARQLPFERYRIDVGGVAMHVAEAGAGVPVLMVHGNPTWGYLYRRVALALPGLRVIMPDLIGLGLSDKPRAAAVHTISRHADWLGRLVDALQLDRFVLVAQDWGGPMATYMAATRRERVRGLVLMNTVVGPPREGFRPTAFHRFSRLPVISDAVFRLGGFPQNILAFAQGDRHSISGDVARAYRWPLRHIADRTAPLALARLVPDSQDHPSIAPLKVCQEMVTSFAGPVALVWGDRDPILGRVRKHMEALLPAAKVTRTQAGHFLQEEVPQEIANAVNDVIARSAV